MSKKPKVAPKPFTPARVRKLAANPGTRSTIPTRLLPEQYQAARALNQRLDAPIAPGSTLTGRQLGRDTKSYITQKYGMGDVAERQGLAQQQQVNTDTSGWYDKYLQDLRTHAANVNTIANQNTAQVAGFGQGLANAGQQALAGQSDPVSQGINQNAADTRARYTGSFGGQAAATGAANKTYADTLSTVVGPGQRLQAQVSGARTLTGLREKAAARADVKGADAMAYRSGRISDEQKILAASAIAQGKSLTSIRTAQIRADATTTAAKTSAGSKTPPVPYYTWAGWKALTPAQKRAAVKDYHADTHPTKPTKPTKKPADKGGLKSTDPQTRFSAAYGQVAASTHDGKPIDAAYARANATTIVNSLVAQGLTRRLALRVVSAYIKNGGQNPGSFKNYGKPGSPAIPGN